MKTNLTTLLPILVLSATVTTFSAFASKSIGVTPGLEDLRVQQFECTIISQEINPDTGKMGPDGNQSYFIVVAPDAKAAKISALNKLNFYGPVEDSLWFQSAQGRQFKVTKVLCH